MLRTTTRLAVALLTATALLTACSAGNGTDPRGPEQAPGATAAPEPTWTPSDDVDLTDREQYAAALEDGVNAARAQLDLPALQHDECLESTATERAAALIGAPELVHAPLPPVQKVCPGGKLAAENLSRTDRPPQDVVRAWLDSPSHRANLISADLVRGAIGCVRDGGTTAAPVLICSHVFLG
ncbi:CAP domain-containing protein [Promicromonospora sp. NPDC057138]|uniref:CAP domain-containing protein n=1 Tax=Promicromonospora sp. NPDC057138 TaxID=3346031 RepID=UPI003638B46A